MISASVLMAPVPPTTSAQAIVTAPRRLCQSNQRMRRDLSSLMVPKRRRRVNGQYSTTPETIATRKSNPHRAEEQLAGLSCIHVGVVLQHHQHRAAADGAERLGGRSS